jgi:hypothetical protein
MDQGGHDERQDKALEIMNAGRRIFADGDRFASGWFDLRSSSNLAVFICAVRPTSEEVDALDRLAADSHVALSVVSVKYSEAQLLAFYERCSDRALPRSCASFGMDAMHNALRLTLRNVDEEALSFFRERVPADALWIEIEPRAPRAFAAGKR